MQHLMPLLDLNLGYGWAAGAVGAALATIGAGYGISKLGSSAFESIARQPEAGGRIQTGFIILAAMLEGVALFSVVVCLLAVLKS